MKKSRRNVIHFSIVIMRKFISCCCILSLTVNASPVSREIFRVSPVRFAFGSIEISIADASVSYCSRSRARSMSTITWFSSNSDWSERKTPVVRTESVRNEAAGFDRFTLPSRIGVKSSTSSPGAADIPTAAPIEKMAFRSCFSPGPDGLYLSITSESRLVVLR
ncbi:hypothetical protein IMSAG025_01745 [Muribaculaceae bacterium]|nr:hypothetical protein IMSAG025_01745 [Muribaculaceae bacterium]